MKHRKSIIVSLVAVISFVSGGWFMQQGENETARSLQKARLFERVLRFVSEYYVDSLEAGELYDMAIEGMLAQLDDPYTSFLRREAFDELSISTTGRYGGVGLRIDLRDGWVTVVNPIADSPGERAGIESGDQIVRIEGMSTRGWDTQRAANVLRGEPGTETSITIVRAGFPDSLDFTLTRAEIHVNSVEGTMMLEPEIGYLRLTTVSEESARELYDAINELQGLGADKLVLDLRNNPGGVLQQGVALADLFLDSSDVVVETRGRAPGSSEMYRATHPEVWPDLPIVVLVDRTTASSAEILAGALQDHDRAVVLGTPTFGKGVAYLLIPLTETEAVTVTSSRWYTPSGRSIQRLRPDMPGNLVARADGATDSTEQTYTTASGRELHAGMGGIQPDIILARDTLTDGERAFADQLGSDIPAYRNVLSRYALDLKGENAITDPDFAVSDAMLRSVLDRLRTAGVEIDEAVFLGARGIVAEQLGNEVTRFVFGRDAELRRMTLSDNQARRAVELLGGIDSPAELLAVIERDNRAPSE